MADNYKFDLGDLDPETLQALLQMGQLDDQSDLLSPIMQGQHHTTGIGGGLGAIAQGLAGYKMADIMKQRKDATGKLGAGLFSFGKKDPNNLNDDDLMQALQLPGSMGES